MRDRLADLTVTSSKDDVTVTVENNTFLDDFFKKVREVQTLIDKVSSLLEDVKKTQNVILSTPNPKQKIKQELELLYSEIKSNANLIQVKLKALQEGLPEDENANSASVYHRIQKTQHTMLSCRFVEVMSLYNEAQCSFRSRSIKRIQRQLQIIGRETTDEEMEAMLQSHCPSIFTSNIISDSQTARQALNEIECRHQDILRLESSIRELHEMFMDIAMLVNTQGELINNIEKNVSSAAEYVGLAKVETKKAVRFQKQGRRKYVIIAVVVLILLAVIALIVGLSVGLPKT